MALLVLGALAVAAGVTHAILLAWTADDAYISFRYAQNLVRGLGLVFNAGERVEGYTNFLWTLLSAAGIRLGVPIEKWADAWSVAAFAGTIALLVGLTARRAKRDGAFAAFPLAALLVALAPDPCVFATSGLETALFTLLALLGYAALERLGDAPDAGRESRAAALAGLALGLAALTRPDGVLFALVAVVYVPWVARARWRATLALLATLAAIGVPYAAWKLAYYGNLLPNTFYAKSGGVAWWSQGLAYLALYARRYPLFVAAPVASLLVAALAPRRAAAVDGASARRAPMVLAAAFVIVYTLYVTRVGGDFMFARLLVPTAPFAALSIEHLVAMVGAEARGRTWAWALAGAALALVLFVPAPIVGERVESGVANEREFYEGEAQKNRRENGRDLRELAKGLPLRVSMRGTEAVVGYYSEVPVLIESSGGLTDPALAHQPLAARGRPGHEKKASLGYLIDQRRAHLELGLSQTLDDTLAPWIPIVHVRYKSLRATCLTWDPPVMAEFTRRGAVVENFPAELDELIRRLPTLSDAEVAAGYAMVQRFYFAGWRDSTRKAAFLQRLSASRPAGEPR